MKSRIEACRPHSLICSVASDALGGAEQKRDGVADATALSRSRYAEGTMTIAVWRFECPPSLLTADTVTV
jgi:hypothetical protein